MSRPKFIDDLAGVAGGAISALSGIGDELEQLVRARIDEALRTMKLVRRDEFDAVLEMAGHARAGQEDAALRIAALERRVQALEKGGRADDEPAHGHEDGGLGGPPPADAD
jgi:BMFP domain-containing protein YqiC